MTTMISSRIARVLDGILAYEVGEKIPIKPIRKDLQTKLEKKYMRLWKYKGYGGIGWGR